MSIKIFTGLTISLAAIGSIELGNFCANAGHCPEICKVESPESPTGPYPIQHFSPTYVLGTSSTTSSGVQG